MSDFELPTPADLGAFFDSGAIMRGRRITRDVYDVRVLEEDEEITVDAFVEGTDTYDTTVTLVRTRYGTAITSNCSCPVGVRCKHGVAVYLLFLAQLQASQVSADSDVVEADGVFVIPPSKEPEPDDAWRRWLGAVTQALQPEEAGARIPLALRFGITVPQPSPWRKHPGPELAITPLKPGKRGWIKTGVGWNVYTQPWRRNEFAEGQFEAMQRLGDALNVYSASPAGNTEIYHSTPRLWAALAQAKESGIEFHTEGLLTGVRVLENPLGVAMDVRLVGAGEAAAAREAFEEEERRLATLPPWQRRAYGRERVPMEGDAVARLAVGLDADGGGHAAAGRELLPVGTSAHGVLIWPCEATGDELVLAPLDRRLPEDITTALAQGGSTLIPREARHDLVRDVLPVLAETVPVVTTQEELRPVPPRPPVLAATIRWQGVERASLGLVFRYTVGERTVNVPAGIVRQGTATHPASVPRRHRTEREVLAAWAPGPAARELLEFTDGVPVSPQWYQGHRLLRLVDELLPELERTMEVIHESGEVPTFRELEGDPEIGFEAVGADGAQSESIDWLDLRVTIEVDGEKVGLPEVLTALSLNEPVLLLPSGSWVSLDHPVFERLRNLVQDADALGTRRPDELRLAAGDAAAWAEAEELGTLPESAGRWIDAAKAVSRAVDGAALEPVEPRGLSTQLRGYQRDGLNWLHSLFTHGLGGILADDMGLGKTLQTLALIALARQQRPDAAPFLIVAPTSVVPAWAHQAAQHAPGLRVEAITETSKKAGFSVGERGLGADVVVTSYTLLRLDAGEYAQEAWSGLVLDEAQNIKNATSKAFKAARAVRAPFALAVTGTPFENRLSELWPLLAIVAPGLYPRLDDFKKAVATPVEKHSDTEALGRLRRKLRPFMLRRTKEMVAQDLPPKQEETLPVTLAAAHQRFYDTLLQRERKQALGLLEDPDGNRVAIFAALTRLRRAALHPGLVEGGPAGAPSAKVTELVERVSEVAQEGHRALVFSQFTSFLGLIREELTAAGIESVYLDGSTRDRGEVLERFREGEAPVFLISLKAGGAGITLTEADYVFVMDPWWNPAVEAQAVDRAHRIGQTRTVMVYRMVSEGTIEHKVMELKEKKAALFEQVIGGGDGTPHALTAEDVRGLFEA